MATKHPQGKPCPTLGNPHPLSLDNTNRRNGLYGFDDLEQIEADHTSDTIAINRRIALLSLTSDPKKIVSSDLAGEITHAIEQSIAHYSIMLDLLKTAQTLLKDAQGANKPAQGGRQ